MRVRTALDNYGMHVFDKGTEDKHSYTVYSFTYEKQILTGLPVIPVRDSRQTLMYTAENADGASYTRKYFTLDGK